MKKYMLIFLSLLSISIADAKFLDKVVEGARSHHSYVSAAVVDKKLVYINTGEDQLGLWAFDSEQNMHIELLATEHVFTVTQLFPAEDAVFFYHKDPDSQNFRLWKTKGTVESTEAVSTDSFVSNAQLVIFGNTILIKPFYDLLILNGSDHFLIELESPRINENCFFTEDNFIISNFFDEGGGEIIQLNSRGDVEQLILLDRHITVNKMLRINEFCYVLYDSQDSSKQLVRVSEDGSLYDLDFANILDFVGHAGFLYAVGESVGGETIKGVFKLSQDGSQVIDVLEQAISSFSSLASAGDYLLISGYKLLNYFDSEFNELVNFQQKREGNPKVIKAKDLSIITPEYRKSNFTLIPHGEEPLTLSLNGFTYENTIFNPFSETYYFQLKDNSNGQSAIYSITDRPSIGQTINGNWYDPMFKNQGVVIRQGKRLDGSKYIFLTLYTFNDGQPLWLSGLAELSSNSTSTTVNLVEYGGLNFMQANEVPAQDIVGEVQLQFVSCNQISATITYKNQLKSLDLQRMDDSKHKTYCLDPVTR